MLKNFMQKENVLMERGTEGIKSVVEGLWKLNAMEEKVVEKAISTRILDEKG